MKDFSFIIGADLVLTKNNYHLFTKGDTKKLYGEKLLKVLESTNYRIFNLEAPLTDKSDPIFKNGPNLIAPTSTIAGIKAINVDLFTLANNHILDHNTSGLISTMNLLDKHKIKHFGANLNLEKAQKPYIIEHNGIKVGFYGCAEHEFTIAKEHKAGANPYDSLSSFDHIEALKAQCDFVIVLYHGGKEYYRYPSLNLQKTCRRFINKGADMIICQNSHCIGTYKQYHNKTIVYGQGNFLFNTDSNN